MILQLKISAKLCADWIAWDARDSPWIVIIRHSSWIIKLGWWLSPTPLKNDGVRQFG